MQELFKRGTGGRSLRRPGVWLVACAAAAAAVTATAGSAAAQQERVTDTGSANRGSIAVTAPASSAGFQTSGTASGQVQVYDAAKGEPRSMPAAKAAKAITAYWTPARRASAIPVAAKAARGTEGTRAKADRGVARTVANPAQPKAGGGVHATVNFSHAEGKVYFVDPRDGKNYQCSGGTVNSGKRRLVLTAGHCVHGGPGAQWMTNWAFLPGYQKGAGPAGIFPYFQLWAQSGWFNNGDRHFDYGIGITWNNPAGQRVVDAVGGNGLIINPGRPFVTAIGYPSNFLGGETQSFCQTTLTRRSVFNSDQTLNCNRGQGASGEPWLKDYNDNSRLGWIVSDNSYSLNADHSAPEYGPYYDGDTQALYQAAENASP
jgi:V8-like Glu-specific endopeptidase